MDGSVNVAAVVVEDDSDDDDDTEDEMDGSEKPMPVVLVPISKETRESALRRGLSLILQSSLVFNSECRQDLSLDSLMAAAADDDDTGGDESPALTTASSNVTTLRLMFPAANLELLFGQFT